MRKTKQKVPTNAANLSWPSDQYRFTTLLKKEVVKATSSVNGQEDKHAVLIATLELALAFAKVKGEADMAARAEQLAALQPQSEEE